MCIIPNITDVSFFADPLRSAGAHYRLRDFFRDVFSPIYIQLREPAAEDQRGVYNTRAASDAAARILSCRSLWCVLSLPPISLGPLLSFRTLLALLIAPSGVSLAGLNPSKFRPYATWKRAILAVQWQRCRLLRCCCSCCPPSHFPTSLYPANSLRRRHAGSHDGGSLPAFCG